MRKEIEIGTKPVLIFRCHMCGSKHETDEWEAKELSMGIIFAGRQEKIPTSKCSTCGMEVTNYEKKRQEDK